MSNKIKLLFYLLTTVSSISIVIGILLLIFISTGLISENTFSVGLSSGVRIVASVVVFGCLVNFCCYTYMSFIKNQISKGSDF